MNPFKSESDGSSKQHVALIGVATDLTCAGRAIRAFHAQPTMCTLLTAILAVSRDSELLRQLNLPIGQYMEFFLRHCMQLSGAQLLSRSLHYNAAILLTQCAKYCGELEAPIAANRNYPDIAPTAVSVLAPGHIWSPNQLNWDCAIDARWQSMFDSEKCDAEERGQSSFTYFMDPDTRMLLPDKPLDMPHWCLVQPSNNVSTYCWNKNRAVTQSPLGSFGTNPMQGKPIFKAAIGNPFDPAPGNNWQSFRDCFEANMDSAEPGNVIGESSDDSAPPVKRRAITLPTLEKRFELKYATIRNPESDSESSTDELSADEEQEQERYKAPPIYQQSGSNMKNPDNAADAGQDLGQEPQASGTGRQPFLSQNIDIARVQQLLPVLKSVSGLGDELSLLETRFQLLQRCLEGPCSSDLAERMRLEMVKLRRRLLSMQLDTQSELPFPLSEALQKMMLNVTQCRVAANEAELIETTETCSEIAQRHLDNIVQQLELQAQQSLISPREDARSAIVQLKYEIDMEMMSPKKYDKMAQLALFEMTEEEPIDTNNQQQSTNDSILDLTNFNDDEMDEKQSEEQQQQEADTIDGEQADELGPEQELELQVATMSSPDMDLGKLKQTVENACESQGGSATLAEVMPSEPAGQVGQHLLATLLLVQEKRATLTNSGTLGQPLTVHQLGIKLSSLP